MAKYKLEPNSTYAILSDDEFLPIKFAHHSCMNVNRCGFTTIVSTNDIPATIKLKKDVSISKIKPKGSNGYYINFIDTRTGEIIQLYASTKDAAKIAYNNIQCIRCNADYNRSKQLVFDRELFDSSFRSIRTNTSPTIKPITVNIIKVYYGSEFIFNIAFDYKYEYEIFDNEIIDTIANADWHFKVEPVAVSIAAVTDHNEADSEAVIQQ